MKVARLDSDRAISAESPTRANRRIGITAFVALTCLLCSGSTAPTTCQQTTPIKPIGPSTGEIVGAGVGIGATVAVVTLVAVNHSHHTLKGCVFNGPNGLRLQTSNSEIYALDGDAVSVQAGDRVKLHGSKAKKTKDDAGDRVFRVEKLTKDYGPCQVNLAQASGMAR